MSIVRLYYTYILYSVDFYDALSFDRGSAFSCCCDTFLPSLPTISGRNMTNNNRAYYTCRCVYYTHPVVVRTIKLESIYKYFVVFLLGRRPWRIFESKFRQIKMERIFILFVFFSHSHFWSNLPITPPMRCTLSDD